MEGHIALVPRWVQRSCGKDVRSIDGVYVPAWLANVKMIRETSQIDGTQVPDWALKRYFKMATLLLNDENGNLCNPTSVEGFHAWDDYEKMMAAMKWPVNFSPL